MKLYHYTGIEYVEAILTQGLSKGEVPMGPKAEDCLNGVWFTTEKTPAGHGLTDGHIPTAEERKVMRIAPDADVRFPNKRRIRMCVDIKSSDPNLTRWVRWSKTRVPQKWLKTLNNAGGGMKKARTWYVYWGVVPPAAIQQVLDLSTGKELSHEGAWQSHSDD